MFRHPVSRGMVGKQQRFEALVSALSTDIFRYAYWLCGDRTVAEDVVQDTFLRAWKSLDQLKDDKAAKGWLITILRRENARRFERLSPPMLDVDEMELAGLGTELPERQVERQALRLSIMALPLEYREPLALQTLGGFSGQEIAAMLDLKLATVNTRLFRARRLLADRLNGSDQTSLQEAQ